MLQTRNSVDVAIAESFKELALTNSIEKITIKEITDKAGLIRPTFYNHFQDKYELLEWIIQSDIFEPSKVLALQGYIDEALLIIFTNLYKEKNFYRRASHLEGQNSFESMIRSGLKNMGLETLGGKDVNLPNWWLTKDRLADYYAGYVADVTISWIKDNMPISPKEMSEVMNYILRTSMLDVMK
ncbi:MAG: TetR/AcrR family transcriptional regulator C-terminal domain-containing protein [Lachnospiraceae bacterium]|nr:TetR/AcrR family transcriptional regulator C-terminal domain-containing protein [Lachnospiraceae bacterium]